MADTQARRMADKRAAEASDEVDLLPQSKRPRIPTIPSTVPSKKAKARSLARQARRMADKRSAEASDEVDVLPKIKTRSLTIPIISSWIVGGLKKYNAGTLQLELFYWKIVREEVEQPIARVRGSWIVCGLQEDNTVTLQLELVLRKIVSEAVDQALACYSVIEGRSMPKQIESPDGRNLVLHFRTKLPSTIFTREEIKGEGGAAIHVVLIDAKTGSYVTSGHEAFAKLNVCVLDGDFNKEDNDNWTEDEFKKHIVREREGKRPLLTGNLQVSLKEGAGTLGRLSFTDNSSWNKSRRFMLGLKVEVAPGCCTTTRIQEAKTGRFMVKERRVHKKHHPPALDDELWRLECIAKDGPFQKKLNEKGIQTVEDFLTSLFRDPQGLRNIIGSGMSDKNGKKLMAHAKTAVLSSRPFVYYLDEIKYVGAIFNKKQDFWGLVEGDQFTSVECLNDRQKALGDTLVNMARANWSSTMKFTKADATTAAQKNPMFDRAGCSSSSGIQRLVPTSVQCSASREGGGVFISSECDGNLAAADPQVPGDAVNIMNTLQPVSHTSEVHQAPGNDGFDDLEAWIDSLIGSPAMPFDPALVDQDFIPQDSFFSESILLSGFDVMQNSAQSSARTAWMGQGCDGFEMGIFYPQDSNR